MINVEQVFIQRRLNGVDIAIQISQMGIININSSFKMKQTIFIGQIIDIYIDIYIAKTVEALMLFLGEYHT